MKKILFFAVSVMLFASCNKEDDGRITNPDAKISLRPAKGVILKAANPAHLTAAEIVERTESIAFINEKVGDQLSRGFGPAQRDIANSRLLLFATDVIKEDGTIKLDFIEGRDFVLYERPFIKEISDWRVDTIAYVPNSVVRAAEIAIKAAYNNKDYAECYRLMDVAFTFTPITGAEWRALRSQGTN